MKLVLDG